MKKHIIITLLSSAFAAVLLGVGCADTEESPAPKSGEDTKSPAKKRPDETKDDAKTAAESTEPRRTDGEKTDEVPPAASKPSDQTNSSDTAVAKLSAEEQLKRNLEKIRELRRQTKFHQAYRVAHEAYQQFRRDLGDTPAFADLQALRAQVAQERRQAGRISTAYRDLSSDQPQRRQVAARMLREAGDVGALFLRKAIREDAPQAASTAAETLLDSGTVKKQTVSAILERALSETNVHLRDSLMQQLRRNAELIPFEGILTSAKTAGQPNTPPALRKQLVNLLAETAEEIELSTEQRRKLYDRVTSDENFAMRFAADYLGLIFQTRAELDSDTFDKLVGVPGATETLRQYAKSATNAEDEDIRAWGELFATRMSELITDGLLIMATADEPPRDANGDAVEFEFTEGAKTTENGVSGTAYAFEGRKGSRKNALSFGPVKTLDQGEAFTVAFWFFRETSHSSRTNHGVRNVMVAHSADNNNDNLEIGSFRSEIDIYIDTPTGDHSRSRNVGFADKQWHHLALTYDSTRDTAAKLYVDGREKMGDFPWTDRLDSADTTPLTLGNSFHHETPFEGRLDEFFLYKRALSENEVTILYRRAAPRQDS